MDEKKDIQLKEKTVLKPIAELTKPGPVFTPEVDILETQTEFTIIADIPGTNPDAIDIDLNENILKISASVEIEEQKDVKELLMEFETGSYFREFHIAELIDQDKINAEYKNGVLRLTLPKAEKALPKKITVSAA